MIKRILALIFLCSSLSEFSWAYSISPLFSAVYKHDFNKLQSLLDSGANANEKQDGTTILLLAIVHKWPEAVQLLIAHGAEVNPSCKVCMLPLNLACSMGQIDIVKVLLESGADVNAVDKFSHTPFYYANKKGYADIIELLQQYGADSELSGVPSYYNFTESYD